jgi:hypothetical protein
MGILDTVTSSIFSKGGSVVEDMFGYEGATLVGYLDTVFNGSGHVEVIKYFYQQLYRDFAPDINGYTMVFFVPPDLSGYATKYGQTLYDQTKDSYMGIVGKIMTFAAVDFTPPQSQVRTENISTRSGSIPIASEVAESETCSITFVDNSNLDIYMFHHIWIEYIREILEGTIAPNSKYFYSVEDNVVASSEEANFYNGDDYGAIDYAASFYIVKYRPDMKTVTFVSKCVGVFPQSLPNKELIGARSSNEIVTLPFTYSCSGYREALYHEESSDSWIFGELNDIIRRFSSQSGSNPLFGGFLGGVLNNIIGPTSGALTNLTGNAANLGGIVGNTQSGLTNIVNSVKGVVGSDGFSKIFSIYK